MADARGLETIIGILVGSVGAVVEIGFASGEYLVSTVILQSPDDEWPGRHIVLHVAGDYFSVTADILGRSAVDFRSGLFRRGFGQHDGLAVFPHAGVSDVASVHGSTANDSVVADGVGHAHGIGQQLHHREVGQYLYGVIALIAHHHTLVVDAIGGLLIGRFKHLTAVDVPQNAVVGGLIDACGILSVRRNR